MYANIKRHYNGRRTLLEATMRMSEVMFNYDFDCGRKGFWRSKPVADVESKPAYRMPDTWRRWGWPGMGLEELAVVVRNLIKQAWREDAFHVVFHSSGYDSRIISSAIKYLLEKNGKEWLGRGLLFLSNRWESDLFKQIMEAQGWDKEHYFAYTWGNDGEHFSKAVYNMHLCAPCPIPGNLWYYLPEYAMGKGAMPSSNIQAFTGLWANESWDCFLKDPNPWEKRIHKQYGHHVMAGLPVLANWVEYPLVNDVILGCIRKNREQHKDGKKLRKDLAHYMCPEAKNIPRRGAHDRKHPISVRMQNELDEYYRQTPWGQKVPWNVPQDSEFSPDWGRWSLALLDEELRFYGKQIT